MDYLDLMDPSRVLRVISKNNTHFLCKLFWIDPKTKHGMYGGNISLPKSLFLSGQEDPRSSDYRTGFMPVSCLK